MVQVNLLDLDFHRNKITFRDLKWFFCMWADNGEMEGVGIKLTCPPYVPTPDEFRKILSEYSYALLVKFLSPAETDDDVICSIYRYWLDPNAPADKKEKATQFWRDHFNGTGSFAQMMLELERTAFNAGNTFAIAFINGLCRLCETCNVKMAYAYIRQEPEYLNMQ